MRQKTRQLAFDWEEEGEALGGPDEGSIAPPANASPAALTQNLIEAMVAAANMRQALKRVKANQGSAGVDGRRVSQLPDYLKATGPVSERSCSWEPTNPNR